MAFCKFSPSFISKAQTMVDNAFISDYLPKAPDLCVKAYLLGLMKCNSAESEDNTIEYFSKTLKVCEDDVISLFKYWEEEGLVQVLSTEPVEIRFLPIQTSASIKKFKVDKYNDFNIQVQELFNKRMVMPNEFAEFYFLIETKHMEERALLQIIKYCVEYKGFNLSPNYVLTVARDWERQGIHTLEQVNAKISELGEIDDNMTLILNAMGSKRKVQLEDKELLNKWLTGFGFEMNVILYVVKLIKSKKRRIDVNVLDENLTKYFEMKLMSIKEIDDYESEKENMYFIATAVNKELGIFYEDLTKEIDTYVVTWINMGFDIDTLKLIADNCFKSSIRTLEGYNNIIVKLFKLGITNTNAYLNYMRDNLETDNRIKAVLDALGLNRNVNNIDRSFFKIWSSDWGFSDEIIIYGASLSANKANAIQYLNKILSNWNNEGLKTVDKVKGADNKIEQKQEFIHNNYTKTEIASFLTNLDEVEV